MASQEIESSKDVITENGQIQENQNDSEDQKNQQEQHELYMKALKQNSLQDFHTDLSSPQPARRFNSPSKRPVSARSTTFQTTNSLKRSQSAMSNFHDPYLRSSNDFKYVGDQFVVGKLGSGFLMR